MSRGAAVSLSDRQLTLVRNAAATLKVEQRSAFLQAVADHLRGTPSDSAVEQAVNNALDRLRQTLDVSATP